ncbi:hypothetical protein [Streptomyces tagetis]|uniref:Uncharacterized protein n=1 Tax=Streptomyces tagetis TaxID=2820809 RepID=A0A941B0T6_9ACTN|nr:hypothetical protein [Streptomyces sp. RG38]MBQ0827695.1 hypothetical protein [Streptomyces sp. RG38]
MGLFGRKTETDKLNAVVDRLPRRAADWTPEQRAAFTAQSDRAMREQNEHNRRRP